MTYKRVIHGGIEHFDLSKLNGGSVAIAAIFVFKLQLAWVHTDIIICITITLSLFLALTIQADHPVARLFLQIRSLVLA